MQLALQGYGRIHNSSSEASFSLPISQHAGIPVERPWIMPEWRGIDDFGPFTRWPWGKSIQVASFVTIWHVLAYSMGILVCLWPDRRARRKVRSLGILKTLSGSPQTYQVPLVYYLALFIPYCILCLLFLAVLISTIRYTSFNRMTGKRDGVPSLVASWAVSNSPCLIFVVPYSDRSCSR